MAFSFEGRCPKCNKEELVWWSKDETENTIEAYLNCENCGREFSKVVVSKDKNTTDKALKKKLRERHNIKK